MRLVIGFPQNARPAHISTLPNLPKTAFHIQAASLLSFIGRKGGEIGIRKLLRPAARYCHELHRYASPPVSSVVNTLSRAEMPVRLRKLPLPRPPLNQVRQVYNGG